MKTEIRYPRQPVRTAGLTFLALSGFVSICLPFAQERIPVSLWPVVYLYCACLSITVVGLLRAGIWIILSIQVAGCVAMLPGLVATSIVLPSGAAREDVMGWVSVSRSLLNAVGVCALIFVAKGWLEYMRPSSTEAAE